MTELLQVFAGNAALLVIVIVYFLPFLIADRRQLANLWSIFFLNLFLGWTLIGWVIALCWSMAGTAVVERE